MFFTDGSVFVLGLFNMVWLFIFGWWIVSLVLIFGTSWLTRSLLSAKSSAIITLLLCLDLLLLEGLIFSTMWPLQIILSHTVLAFIPTLILAALLVIQVLVAYWGWKKGAGNSRLRQWPELIKALVIGLQIMVGLLVTGIVLIPMVPTILH